MTKTAVYDLDIWVTQGNGFIAITTNVYSEDKLVYEHGCRRYKLDEDTSVIDLIGEHINDLIDNLGGTELEIDAFTRTIHYY